MSGADQHTPGTLALHEKRGPKAAASKGTRTFPVREWCC